MLGFRLDQGSTDRSFRVFSFLGLGRLRHNFRYKFQFCYRTRKCILRFSFEMPPVPFVQIENFEVQTSSTTFLKSRISRFEDFELAKFSILDLSAVQESLKRKQKWKNSFRWLFNLSCLKIVKIRKLSNLRFSTTKNYGLYSTPTQTNLTRA